MSNRTVHCRSAAKVNLTLDILDIRADGYHELSSIIHTVGLYDELEFEFGRPAELVCNRQELSGDDNLCLRAAKLYLETAGLRAGDAAKITLKKTIPAGAGLGGGSGNAAATLRAFNNEYGALSESELVTLAAKLGADVPLFLSGGAQLMEGIGERLSPLPSLQGWLLIAQPAEPGPTAAVYRAWDDLNRYLPRKTETATAAILQKLQSTEVNYEYAANQLAAIAPLLQNDLTEAAQACAVPATGVIEALKACGALGACMTGSGSAAVGLFDSEETARKGQERLETSASVNSHVAFTLRHSFVVPFCKNALEFDR